MKNRVANTCAGALLAFGLCSSAMAETALNVDPAVHPHIAEAQRLISMADQQVANTEQAHHHSLGGHAGRARAFLQQAADELKQAQLVVD